VPPCRKAPRVINLLIKIGTQSRKLLKSLREALKLLGKYCPNAVNKWIDDLITKIDDALERLDDSLDKGPTFGSRNAGAAARPRKKRKSGQSAREAANDRPSWAEGEAPYFDENGREFAKRRLDDRYGEGCWKGTGPNSEFNKLEKYGDRAFE